MHKNISISRYVTRRSCFISSRTTSIFSALITDFGLISRNLSWSKRNHNWIRYTNMLHCSRMMLHRSILVLKIDVKIYEKNFMKVFTSQFYFLSEMKFSIYWIYYPRWIFQFTEFITREEFFNYCIVKRYSDCINTVL